MVLSKHRNDVAICKKAESFAEDVCKAVARDFRTKLPWVDARKYADIALNDARVPFTSMALLRNYSCEPRCNTKDMTGLCLITWLRGGELQVTSQDLHMHASFGRGACGAQ